MPVESVFNGEIKSFQENKTKKSKIQAIGKKANQGQLKDVPLKKSKDEDWSKQFKDVRKNHEENFKMFHTKSKRNKVAIVILSILLVITLFAIGIYSFIASLEINCYMMVHGAEAVCIVDGEEISKFRAPSNLQGNRVMELNIELRIDEPGRYKIKFIPECYQNGRLIDNTLIYNYNANLFYDGGDGYCYSKNEIQGRQTVSLCGGLILDYYYENTLNVNNFKLEFHVYLEKV